MADNVMNDAIAKVQTDTMLLYPTQNKVTTELDPKIKRVIDINPNNNQTINIVKSAQSATTLYTVPTGNTQFYLTNVYISALVASVSTTSNAQITFVTSDGVTQQIYCIVQGQAGTLGDGTPSVNHASVQFPLKGVLLKPGSNVLSLLVGSAQAAFQIAGYTQDKTVYSTNLS